MQLASYYYRQDHFLKLLTEHGGTRFKVLQGGGRWVTRTGVAGYCIWTWPYFGKLSSGNVSDPVSPRDPLARGTLSFILLGNCGISMLVLFLRLLGTWTLLSTFILQITWSPLFADSHFNMGVCAVLTSVLSLFWPLVFVFSYLIAEESTGDTVCPSLPTRPPLIW